MVVFSHYIIGFSTLQNWLYNPGEINIYQYFYDYISWIDGAYGVAVFFIISGFLIPISLERYKAKRFLIARFFRLIPVYAVCLFVVVCISFIFGTREFSTSIFSEYFLNITLMRDVFAGKMLDSVIWTLEIEAKFYLYLALLYVLLNKRFYYCIWINIVILSLVLISSISSLYKYSGALSFMFIGVCFYFIQMGDVKSRIISAAAVIPNLYIMDISFSRYYGHDLVSAIYLKSLLACVIVAFMIVVFKLKTPKLVMYIANISYPLYAVHTIGYPLLSYFVYKLEFGGMGVILTLFIVTIISHFIHRLIEKPSINFGKKNYQGFYNAKN
jgi:peptidoglycan/LPS O-acetylase OafA/YrhL